MCSRDSRFYSIRHTLLTSRSLILMSFHAYRKVIFAELRLMIAEVLFHDGISRTHCLLFTFPLNLDPSHVTFRFLCAAKDLIFALQSPKPSLRDRCSAQFNSKANAPHRASIRGRAQCSTARCTRRIRVSWDLSLWLCFFRFALDFIGSAKFCT